MAKQSVPFRVVGKGGGAMDPASVSAEETSLESPEQRIFRAIHAVSSAFAENIPSPLTRSKLAGQLRAAADTYLVEKLSEAVAAKKPRA
jgi:hypothetical protein